MGLPAPRPLCLNPLRDWRWPAAPRGDRLTIVGLLLCWDAVTVDSPFDPPPLPGDSFISIAQFNGASVFDANSYTYGTVFQTYRYGMAVGVVPVVSNNSFTEMFDTGTGIRIRRPSRRACATMTIATRAATKRDTQ